MLEQTTGEALGLRRLFYNRITC